MHSKVSELPNMEMSALGQGFGNVDFSLKAQCYHILEPGHYEHITSSQFQSNVSKFARIIRLTPKLKCIVSIRCLNKLDLEM